MNEVKNRQRKTTDKIKKKYGNMCHNAGVNNV